MTLAEIQALIADHAPEGPTLEFKAGAALGKSSDQRKELVKDVSGMANGAGGRVIYGVAEAEKDGIKIASKPYPVADKEMTGDWMTQVIKSNTMPPLNCFKCEEFAVAGGRFIVVEVEQSTTAHQSLRDHKYYGRGAATTEPMVDHQIRDVMNRRNAPVINVSVGRTITSRAADEHLYQLLPCLENIGTRTLERWSFDLAVPNAAVNPDAARSDLGYLKRREGLGIEYLWLTMTHRPPRIDMNFDVHPGQTLTIDRALNAVPIPLRIDPKIYQLVGGRPILWRIYSLDARPIEGEIAFEKWCDF